MPKKAPQIITESILQEPSNNDAPDIYIQNVLAQLGDTLAILQLYRADNMGKFSYVDDIDPANFSLRTIKEIYGGGHYKITIIDEKHRFHGRSKDFHIEGISKNLLTDSELDFDDQSLSIPEIGTLQTEVRELKSLVTALITRQTQNQNPSEDNEERFLNKLVTYKQLFSQGNNLTDNLGVLTEIFTRSLDFANRLNGPPEETPLTLVREFLPNISNWISDYMDMKRGSVNNQLTQKTGKNPPDLKTLIDRSYKAFLIQMIALNAKIPEVVNMITTKASEPERDRIKEILSLPDPVNHLTGLINNQSEGAKKYLTNLVNKLKEAIK